MALRISCHRCSELNPPALRSCAGCGAWLLPSRTFESEDVPDRSWGLDLVARAEQREVPRIECASCGAQTPERYAFCIGCGRSPRARRTGARERPCPSCGAPGAESQRFCIRCGDPMAETGGRGYWRVEGCPGCWADLDELEAGYCGECGARVPPDLMERRELLREVQQRRLRASYRGIGAVPELHPGRAEMSVRTTERAVWLSLRPSVLGAVELHGVVSRADAPPVAGHGQVPPGLVPDGAVARLARFVSVRLDRVRRSRDEALVEAVSSFLDPRGERLRAAETSGDAAFFVVAFADVPGPGRVDGWIDAALSLPLALAAGIS
jgi:hypothetical protein